MNKERRKAIADISQQASDLQDRLSSLKEQIETLRDEEQEYLDNMPDSFKDGDKGSTAQEAIDALEAAMEACDTADGAFDDVVNNLSTAEA